MFGIGLTAFVVRLLTATKPFRSLLSSARLLLRDYARDTDNNNEALSLSLSLSLPFSRCGDVGHG